MEERYSRHTKGPELDFNHHQELEAVTLPGKFSKETKRVLRREGYVIYSSKGPSLHTLQEKGLLISSTWHKNLAFEFETTKPTEVAINPNELWVPNSNNPTASLQRQIEGAAEHSQTLSERIPNIMARMVEANLCIDVYLKHLKKKGEWLPGNSNVRTLSTDDYGSKVVSICHFDSTRGLDIGYSPDFDNPLKAKVPIFVFPLN